MLEKEFFVKLKNLKNYSFGLGAFEVISISSNKETLMENIFIEGVEVRKVKSKGPV